MTAAFGSSLSVDVSFLKPVVTLAACMLQQIAVPCDKQCDHVFVVVITLYTT